MVRRSDTAVDAASTRPQWLANERPINPAPPFKQATPRSGWSVWCPHRILESSLRNGERDCFPRSVQVCGKETLACYLATAGLNVCGSISEAANPMAQFGHFRHELACAN